MQTNHPNRRRNSFEESFQDIELEKLEEYRRRAAIQDRLALLIWTIIGSGIIGVIKWLG